MKKVLDFLEQNVQWVVIAVGVLYLVFMAWTFLINSPVSVTVDGEKLGPGDVDKLIYERPVATLSAQMGKAPPVPEAKLAWADDFKSAMDLSHTKPFDLNAKPWIDAVTVALPGMEPTDPYSTTTPERQITELPTIPAA